MMKFLLGLIAVIFMSLVIYVSMGSNGKQRGEKEVTKLVELKDSVSQAKQVEGTEKQVVHSKVNTLKKTSVKEADSMMQTQVTSEVKVESEIGKGLTLEGIESMDVSDEEKASLRDDLAYREGLEAPYETPSSEEDILKDIVEDSKESTN